MQYTGLHLNLNTGIILHCNTQSLNNISIRRLLLTFQCTCFNLHWNTQASTFIVLHTCNNTCIHCNTQSFKYTATRRLKITLQYTGFSLHWNGQSSIYIAIHNLQLTLEYTAFYLHCKTHPWNTIDFTYMALDCPDIC